MYEQNWKIQENNIEGEQLSISRSIRNEIQENLDNTYMNATYNPSRNNSEQKEDQKNKTWALPKVATCSGTDQYI